MVRTAAVVGTATATRNAVERHQAEKNARAYANAVNTVSQETAQQYAPPPQQQYYAPPPQQYAPPPQQYEAPPQIEYAPAPQDDMISQLERLGALKAQGVLTEEEFAAAKQKLLTA
jgi:hypothetical protein